MTSRVVHLSRRLMVVPLALAVTVAGMSRAGAAQAPVGLGTSDSFAVLAGAGITNTGATTILGDVGTSPTPSEAGFGTVSLTGANHVGTDAVAVQAKTDLVTAYDTAFGATPSTVVATELGGLTKKPGVYNGGTLGITGTLTLDAVGDPNAVFIFKTASTLITASASQVALINGAQACNVFWQVASSATLATNSVFVGTILALTSIAAQTGATINGRLLARNGAVTLDANTITRSACSATGGTTSTTAPPAGSTAKVSGSSTATTAGSAATAGAATGSAANRGASAGTGATGTLAVTGQHLAVTAMGGLLAIVVGGLMVRGSAPRTVEEDWYPAGMRSAGMRSAGMRSDCHLRLFANRRPSRPPRRSPKV